MNWIAILSRWSVLTASLATVALAQGSGYWHTSGNRIVDSNNQTVRIAGVNWYGFETTDEVAHGLWAQDYKAILNAVRSNGYNTIRLPFSNQMVENPIVPSNISFNGSGGAINSDLKNQNSLEIMDKIIAYAGQIGLRIVLDNHRSEAGNSAQANGLWYAGQYTEQKWIDDWTALAARYKGNTAVIGADLRNEPHNATSGGACWGCGSPANDWRLAAERGGNAVLAANPNWLIFVEGTDCFNGSCDWWGGNLQGAQQYPVRLSNPTQLVYSAHDYGPREYGQSWFNGSTTADSLKAVWTKNWAYLSLNGIAPVWVGEFGTPNNAADIASAAPGSQGQWFQSLVSFLNANANLSWTYWALNGEDSYGLLDSNYSSTPASAAKQQALASIQTTLAGGTPSCASAPAAPAGLSAAAASASRIELQWTASPAPAGCMVTYTVYQSTDANNTVSAANIVSTGSESNSYAASGLQASTTYYFAVTASDAAGSSSPSAVKPATTQASVSQPAPAPPGDLAAMATSATSISLTWRASATAGVTYNVYRGTTADFLSSSPGPIARGVNGASYASNGLATGTSYFFAVTAANGGGESPESNVASAATLSPAPGGAACHVDYVVNSQWNTGFNVGINIHNTGASAVNGWTLTWTFAAGQNVAQAWNANAVSSGPNVVFSNASWNNSIPAGAGVSGVGFNGNYSGSNPAPVVFYLNGTMCR